MQATVIRQPLVQSLLTIPKGEVYIIPERCKGCRFCIDFCPKDVLEESQDMNHKGYHYAVVAPGKEDGCVQCGFCELVCPEFAIYSREAAGSVS